MKKILVMVSFLCVSLLSMAQADTTMKVKRGGKHPNNKHNNHGEKVKQVANAASYGCPKCFEITKAGGMCANDQTEMVQLGTYYCEKCVKSTGAKPGKCGSCSGATTQMTRKACAKHHGAGKGHIKKAA
jgi:hypothetical protein